MQRVLAVMLIATLFCGTAVAQDTSALINEELDRLVNLDINTVLPQAMKSIEEKTGVPIGAEPAVWELLPWGEQTNIAAKIENGTLRQALTAITTKLGLTFDLEDEAVELRPLPALRRLGRRSTVQELQALDLLASTPMNASADRLSLKQLVAAVDQRLIEAKAPFAVEFRPNETVNENEQVNVARNASMLDTLESMAKQTNVTWYPWGKSIVIVPKEDQVRNQLAKIIDLRFNGVDVSHVISELQQRSGVAFTIEPGAIQRIPAEFRTIRLVIDDASIAQALDNLAGFTGLGYVVRGDGVYIWNQQNQGGGAGPRDRLVGLIPLDNGMQIAVPESQIPADLREYLKARTQRELDKIRQMMNEEGFKPTTQPTQPADQDL